MSYRFERPVGAAADARELEYIAALHQTDDKQDNSWMDGSIEAEDVKNFLLSRYGIKVTKEEVTDLIFADMGGGDTDDECIDLTEGAYHHQYCVAVLFITTAKQLRISTYQYLSVLWNKSTAYGMMIDR